LKRKKVGLIPSNIHQHLAYFLWTKNVTILNHNINAYEGE